LQEELNKSKKITSIKKAPVLSDKYKGLNCDDFISALMNDKIQIFIYLNLLQYICSYMNTMKHTKRTKKPR
jgi:hypothetical protein